MAFWSAEVAVIAVRKVVAPSWFRSRISRRSFGRGKLVGRCEGGEGVGVVFWGGAGVGAGAGGVAWREDWGGMKMGVGSGLEAGSSPMS